MRSLRYLARTCYYQIMKTYDYELVTDRFTANGQVDAEDESAAKALVERQVKNPPTQHNMQGIKVEGVDPAPPKIQSIKVSLHV